MSIAFNKTDTLNGIIQLYEKEIGANQGDISGNTARMKEATADINLALDDFFAIALPASGTWQLDDSNQTDYPIITTNLVDGQRDYSFTTDGTGNLILDIYKVFVKNSSTAPYQEIYPLDQQSDWGTEGFTDGQNIEGAPLWYDKTANGLFLDPIPSANVTNGLKVYINREATYFTTSDTTKKPGVPGLFHEYFAINPAYKYACRKSLSVEASLFRRKNEMEQAIKNYFGHRSQDERDVLTMRRINFR